MSELIISATPRCPHFGTCGGCQLQDVAYDAQLLVKRNKLEALLHDAGLRDVTMVTSHSAEPYGYRNRIRLRIQRDADTLRFGYNLRGTTEFLPIITCPIAAAPLWSMAESLRSAADNDRDATFWLDAAAEVELFCDHTTSRMQMTLLCAPRTKAQTESFARAFATFQQHAPTGLTLMGAGAVASDPRTGPTGRMLAQAGAAGLAYAVLGETYWITRGGFFQINRFLVTTLVQLVTNGRNGALAWDLFAGVGLFSRLLARSFARVTAVEANAAAGADNRAALAKLGQQHQAIESTTLDFLQRALLDRDRPELVVLDPPRAGAGVDACALLARIAPQTIVYVSCDPATLARDLAVLQPHYRITALHLVDLFPQTVHLETVAILERSH